jgi:hypothetical protein
MSESEVQKRETAARAAIRQSFGTAEGEFGADLFTSHHLDELDRDYWLKHLGTSNPEPVRILDILELRSHWGHEDEDGMEVFDFTLPDAVTDYVISVRFNESGEVEEISMES